MVIRILPLELNIKLAFAAQFAHNVGQSNCNNLTCVFSNFMYNFLKNF